MGQALGKVVGDLEAPRGPDVELQVRVQREWFGSKVGISLPRNLNCAACSGGGCDRCARAGALSLWDRGGEARSVQVVLPALPEAAADVCVRLPGEGAAPLVDEANMGRGHLLLKLRPSASSDPGVVLYAASPTPSSVRAQLMRRSLIMASILIVLFLLLLRLSGWL